MYVETTAKERHTGDVLLFRRALKIEGKKTQNGKVTKGYRVVA